MCSPQEEIKTFRDFVFCQNPEISDTLEYVLNDDQTKAAEDIVENSCGPPCTEGFVNKKSDSGSTRSSRSLRLPTIQGTAVVKSFEEASRQSQQSRLHHEQARDDDHAQQKRSSRHQVEPSRYEEEEEEEEEVEEEEEEEEQNEYEEVTEDPSEPKYRKAERYLRHNSSIVEDFEEEEEDSLMIARKKIRQHKERKKDKHKHHKHRPKQEPMYTKPAVQNPEGPHQFVVKDRRDLEVVKKMIHKYDKASARAAPNLNLHKVFENEEFITFRKVPEPIRSSRGFGGYDETEVRIEQNSTATGSLVTTDDGMGSPVSRVPRQVMIVISKKKL